MALYVSYVLNYVLAQLLRIATKISRANENVPSSVNLDENLIKNKQMFLFLSRTEKTDAYSKVNLLDLFVDGSYAISYPSIFPFFNCMCSDLD